MELAPEVTSVGCLGKVGLTTKVSGILGILRGIHPTFIKMVNQQENRLSFFCC